jgi:hypothetical protein
MSDDFPHDRGTNDFIQLDFDKCLLSINASIITATLGQSNNKSFGLPLPPLLNDETPETSSHDYIDEDSNDPMMKYY